MADHSDFPAEPFQRLWRTMDAMLRVSFGDADQSREAAEQITEVHRRVASRRRDGVGYRAMDPDLLLWVHATVVDSALVVHRCFFRALTPDQEARYYHEMKRLATAMHVPSGILPSGLEEFRTYMAGVVERVEVSEDARRLAPSILRPPLLPRWGRCRSW